MKSDYYKGKYLIALYDKEDFIIGVADNIIDLLNVFSIPVNKASVNQMTSKIGHALKRKNKKIWINDQPAFIYLIPIENEVSG